MPKDMLSSPSAGKATEPDSASKRSATQSNPTSSTPAAIWRGQLTPRAVLGLQRRLGNQVVQRIIMSGAELRAVAGEPKEDVNLLITTKKMSENYKDVIKKLDYYRTELGKRTVAHDQQGRKDDYDHFVFVLDAIQQVTTTYLNDHASDILKLKNKKSALSSKEEQQVKRYNLISSIRFGQIQPDRDALQAINGATTHAGRSWMSALLEVGTTNDSLETSKLTGNPLEPNKGTNQESRYGTVLHGHGFKAGPRTPTNDQPPDPDTGFFQSAQVVANEDNPVVKQAGQGLPQTNQLYTLGPVADLTTPNHVRPSSSIAAPKDHPVLDERAMYLGGGPSIDDINQRGIGDCYFLAALTSVVNQDPGLIQRMMTVSGNNVSVDFYRFNPNLGGWQKQRVTIDREMAIASGAGLKGAGVKVGGDPIRTEWWAEMQQVDLGGGMQVRGGNRRGRGQLQQDDDNSSFSNLHVHRREYFPAATWVGLLEKAYARFAQQFGQYGVPDLGHKTKKEDTQEQLPGWEIIHGGYEMHAYGIFYGDKAASGKRNDAALATSYNPKEGNAMRVLGNLGIIKKLLQRVQGGLTENGQGVTMHLTASATPENHIKRAIAAVKDFQGNNTALQYVKDKLGNDPNTQFLDKLNLVLEQLEAFKDSASDKKADELDPLSQSAQAVVGKDVQWLNTLLEDGDNKPKIIRDMTLLLINMVSIGSDSSLGQRNIYSKHAYTIMGATFADSGGQAIPNLNAESDLNDMQKINLEQSKVQLRNPHRANTPDPTGAQETGTLGNFELTLDQFIQQFSRLEVGLVKD